MQREWSAALADTDGRRMPGDIGNGRGWSVYRNNVFHARLQALRDSFPVVEALVGEECFAALARDMPVPAVPALAEWTVALPAFLKRTPLAESVPYLADVARIEVALVAVAHAEDTAGQHVEPDMLKGHLRLARSAQLLMSHQPAYAIWKRHVNDAEFPPADRSGCCVLYRDNFDIQDAGLRPEAAAHLLELGLGADGLDWFGRLPSDESYHELIGAMLAAGAIQIDRETK